MALGEWTHGWQFHASDPLEHSAHRHVIQDLGGGPTARTNAATMGKARIYSAMGPYAAIWLTVWPTTTNVSLDNKLAVETYGRWGKQAVELVPKLAQDRTKGVHPRVRRGMALGLLHRWWGILGIAVQKAVARAVHNPYGDLPTTPLEPLCGLADLEVV